MGLLRNALLVNQKKSSSCRCVCRKLHVERSSCNDITCFSNGCCNVVCLVETAHRLLSFLLEVHGGRVSPRCKGHPKKEDYREDYREGYRDLYNCVVSLLTPSQRYSMIEEEEACQLWPEKKWLLEMVIEGVVVVSKRKLWDLKRVYKWSITEHAIRTCSVLWQLQDFNIKKKSWLSLLYWFLGRDKLSLRDPGLKIHVMVFIPSTCSRITSRVSSRIWPAAMWCICHLRADSVVWLSHTSSVWPLSGVPKVHLNNTFLGGLRQK